MCVRSRLCSGSAGRPHIQGTVWSLTNICTPRGWHRGRRAQHRHQRCSHAAGSRSPSPTWVDAARLLQEIVVLETGSSENGNQGDEQVGKHEWTASSLHREESVLCLVYFRTGSSSTASTVIRSLDRRGSGSTCWSMAGCTIGGAVRRPHGGRTAPTTIAAICA